MTLRRTLLLGGGALGLAFAVRSAISEPTTRAAAQPPVRDPVVALQREVDQLKHQVARPRVVAIPRGEPSAALPAPEPAPQADAPLEPARVAEHLEARVAAEPTNLGAAETLRAALGGALSQSRTSLGEVACGASLCRAALLHGDLDAQRELAPAIAGLPALRAGVFYSYVDGASPPRTVLYILAEGHDFGELL